VDQVSRGGCDVVLMDVQMPVMDGLEATRVIRALQGPQAAVPIIAMTANAMADDRQRCLDAGMNDYLAKPIDQRVLFAALARWTTARLPPPVAPVAMAAAGSAIFDPVAAARRLGGNEVLLRKLVRRFLDEPDPLLKLRAELGADDRSAALITVHTLKGVSGTLGAEALQKAAGQAEKQLRTARSQAEIDRLLEALAACAAQAREALAQYLAEQQPAAAPVRRTAGELPGLAAELERRLAENEDAAFACYEALHAALDEAGRQQLQAVGRHMSGYDFQRAREALRVAVAALDLAG